MSLTWTASAGPLDSYVVEYGQAVAVWNRLDTATSATSLQVSDVPTETNVVRIRGKNSCGFGAPSNEAILTISWRIAERDGAVDARHAPIVRDLHAPPDMEAEKQAHAIQFRLELSCERAIARRLRRDEAKVRLQDTVPQREIAPTDDAVPPE